MSDDKVKEVAAEMREWALDGGKDSSVLPQFAGPERLGKWADLLDPPPEPPLRWWAPPEWATEQWLRNNPGFWSLLVREKCPGYLAWAEVCIHSADAPHCDKPEHADPPGWRCVPPEPHCDVEGHADLERQANDFAVEVERLRRRISELAALLREVGRKMHNMNAPGDSSFPFEECGGDPCSRVRAALHPHDCKWCKGYPLSQRSICGGEGGAAMSALECGHDARCWVDECPPGCGEADLPHCIVCRARAEALEEAAKVSQEWPMWALDVTHEAYHQIAIAIRALIPK